MEGGREGLEFPGEVCYGTLSGSSRNTMGLQREHAGLSSIGREAISADGHSSRPGEANRTSTKRKIVDV